MACHDDKVKCEWIVNSNAGSEDTGSMSGAVASSSQVPSSPVVASSSRVSCSSPPQHETHASVDALQEIVEAIREFSMDKRSIFSKLRVMHNVLLRPRRIMASRWFRGHPCRV